MHILCLLLRLTETYNGPFSFITTSTTFFHLSLSNVTSISRIGLIPFKDFLTVSYHLCQGLPLGLFPIKFNYFS